MQYKHESARTVVIVWYVLVIVIIFAGLTGLVFSLTSYPTLKSLFDALAKDGNFERFTLLLYQSIHLPLIVLSSGLLVIGLISVWKARESRLAMDGCVRFLRGMAARLQLDARRLAGKAAHSAPPTWEVVILLAIMAVGLVGRLVFIQHGMEYDESYTYMEFARHPFRQIISDYHHPNNHVFHTLLVHWVTRLFGGAPWAVRIPACTAGMLAIPAVYALGRRLYRPWIGLLAAAILAAAPVMIGYSTNARGYTLITLFTLLLFIQADIVRKEKNLAAWALMILVTALGFYTIPIMLYPFGIIFTWMFLSGVTHDIDACYQGWKGWLRYLVVYGVSSALLSMFFYLPIFRVKGLFTVFNNDPIIRSSSPADFFSTLPIRYHDFLADWFTKSVPGWLVTVVLVGILLSIVLHSRVARSRVNILLAALLFIVPVLLVQRPLLLPRVWVFSVPLLVLAAAAGWFALLGLIPLRMPSPGLLQNGAAALALIAVLAGAAAYLAPFVREPSRIYFGTADSAALVTQYIKANLADGDVVVATPLYDARFWYYFNYYQIPDLHIRDIKRQHFTRAVVIAPHSAEITLAQVVHDFGPDKGFLLMDTAQMTFRSGFFEVYQIAANQAEVDKVFGAPAGK